MTWDQLLAYATGLALVAPDLNGAMLVRTVIVVHLCHAVMCRLFAHNEGYSKAFWTIAGFVVGIWAVIVLMALPAFRARRPPQ